MSQWIAKTIQLNRAALPFASFFQPNTVLVPVPKSSLMRPDSLWVPLRIASALVGMGLGKTVAPCLIRMKPVAKAAFSVPQARPTVVEHYESLSVQGHLSELDDILLVDDIITRGATLLGAANRLIDAFPHVRIRGFASMRTVSNPDEFEALYAPYIGTIELRPSGDTLRRP